MMLAGSGASESLKKKARAQFKKRAGPNMATEVPIGDLQPEAASGEVEKVADEATVLSLEDEKIRLIALLSAFDENPQGLAGKFEEVKGAMAFLFCL